MEFLLSAFSSQTKNEAKTRGGDKKFPIKRKQENNVCSKDVQLPIPKSGYQSETLEL